jgi:hypothetical protein
MLLIGVIWFREVSCRNSGHHVVVTRCCTGCSSFVNSARVGEVNYTAGSVPQMLAGTCVNNLWFLLCLFSLHLLVSL